MPTTGLVYDDRFLEHETGAGHPERPQRLAAIRRYLERTGLWSLPTRIEPFAADNELLLTNHTREYIDRLAAACIAGRSHIDCVDSAICPRSCEVARWAVGGVIRAVDEVMTGTLKNAFCAVRPPGHHAEADRSMGFCLFNNIALAARRLIAQHGLGRVLILDWDVHHGNGTQHSFDADPRVFYCSFHQHPATLYPGTGYADERGIGEGVGTTLNIPFLPGAGDREYREAFETLFLPAARAFDPQFVLISAGFDAHRDDPLAQINLETLSFEWLSREMTAFAKATCGGRLVSILEGGYDLDALGDCASIHLRALLEA